MMKLIKIFQIIFLLILVFPAFGSEISKEKIFSKEQLKDLFSPVTFDKISLVCKFNKSKFCNGKKYYNSNCENYYYKPAVNEVSSGLLVIKTSKQLNNYFEFSTKLSAINVPFHNLIPKKFQRLDNEYKFIGTLYNKIANKNTNAFVMTLDRYTGDLNVFQKGIDDNFNFSDTFYSCEKASKKF